MHAFIWRVTKFPTRAPMSDWDTHSDIVFDDYTAAKIRSSVQNGCTRLQ